MLFTSLYQKWFSSCLGLPAMSVHLKDDGRLEDGSQEGNGTLEDVSSDGSYLADGLNWGKELKNWVHTLNSSGKDFFKLGGKKKKKHCLAKVSLSSSSKIWKHSLLFSLCSFPFLLILCIYRITVWILHLSTVLLQKWSWHTFSCLCYRCWGCCDGIFQVRDRR